MFSPQRLMQQPPTATKKKLFEDQLGKDLLQFCQQLMQYLDSLPSYELKYMVGELQKDNVQNAIKILTQKMNRTSVDVLHPFNEVLCSKMKQVPLKGQRIDPALTQQVKLISTVIEEKGTSSSGFRAQNFKKRVQTADVVKRTLVPEY